MEKITDIVRIGALLHQLVEKRALLEVTLKNQKQAFTSTILDVDHENDYFILDELKPESGNSVLKHTPKLHIRGQLGGISMDFNATVFEFGLEDNIPFYKLSLPKKINYLQRRQAVRVKLNANNVVSVTFTLADGQKITGLLDDISIGGLRARFDENLPNTIARGEKLSCAFELPPDNNEVINCNFVIRSVKHDKNKFGPPFIGGEFRDLLQPMVKHLQRTIMILQRASRQHSTD